MVIKLDNIVLKKIAVPPLHALSTCLVCQSNDESLEHRMSWIFLFCFCTLYKRTWVMIRTISTERASWNSHGVTPVFDVASLVEISAIEIKNAIQSI